MNRDEARDLAVRMVRAVHRTCDFDRVWSGKNRMRYWGALEENVRGAANQTADPQRFVTTLARRMKASPTSSPDGAADLARMLGGLDASGTISIMDVLREEAPVVTVMVRAASETARERRATETPF